MLLETLKPKNPVCKLNILGSLGPDPKPAIQNLKTWDIFQFQKWGWNAKNYHPNQQKILIKSQKRPKHPTNETQIRPERVTPEPNPKPTFDTSVHH